MSGRKAWLSDGKRADRAPEGLLHSLFSAFFYSHLCDLFSKSAGAFPLRRRSVIELLEEVAAVLIGHTWLFHRWPIYLSFRGGRRRGGRGSPAETSAQKGGGRGNGTELCRKVRTERRCSLGAASHRCAGETRASLRGNKTSGTKDKRLERAGILPPWQQPTGGWFRLFF